MKEEKKSYGNLNIYQKMLLAMEKIETVKKSLEVGTGKNKYSAVGEADVLKSVKPIEIELGIYSYPISRKIVDTNILTTTSEWEGKTTEKNQLFMRIETIYRFINTDDKEDFIDVTTYGDGVDSQDKAPGKAMTYADKYALLKAYKIETGDDLDKEASGNLKNVGKRNDNPSPYDFVVEDNLTNEQQMLLATLDPETKDKIRNKFKKDPLLLSKVEADSIIPKLIEKGLVRTASQLEEERKNKEEVF